MIPTECTRLARPADPGSAPVRRPLVEEPIVVGVRVLPPPPIGVIEGLFWQHTPVVIVAQIDQAVVVPHRL